MYLLFPDDLYTWDSEARQEAPGRYLSQLLPVPTVGWTVIELQYAVIL